MTANWAASCGFAIPRFLTDGTCVKTLLSASVHVSEHSMICVYSMSCDWKNVHAATGLLDTKGWHQHLTVA